MIDPDLMSLQEKALGRISYTSDLWSDINLVSYMAVTAHYCALNRNGHLDVCSKLVAFREVQGRHTGENLAEIFVSILKEINGLDRACIFAAIVKTSPLTYIY